MLNVLDEEMNPYQAGKEDEPIILLSSNDVKSMENANKANIVCNKIYFFPLWLIFQLTLAYQNGILKFKDTDVILSDDFEGSRQIEQANSDLYLKIVNFQLMVFNKKLYNQTILMLLLIQGLLMMFIMFFGVNSSKKGQATLMVEMQIPVTFLFISLKGTRFGME